MPFFYRVKFNVCIMFTLVRLTGCVNLFQDWARNRFGDRSCSYKRRRSWLSLVILHLTAVLHSWFHTSSIISKGYCLPVMWLYIYCSDVVASFTGPSRWNFSAQLHLSSTMYNLLSLIYACTLCSQMLVIYLKAILRNPPNPTIHTQRNEVNFVLFLLE